MCLKKDSERIEVVLYFILLALVGFWFLCLNWNTPFMHDDLAYHYYYDDNSAIERPTSEPISSFWQIFPSMWNHYNAVNGRFTSHFIIQLFCGLLGKRVFNYFNTIVFLFFIDLIVLLSNGKRGLLPLALVVTSIVFLLPFPGQTMLWLTGSVNYLWSATFSLAILKIISSVERKTLIPCLLLFLFAIFSGWMNESISFGIGGGLVIYFLINRSLLTGVSRWMTIGYLIGCLLILLSPGTMYRVTSGEINTDMSVLQMLMSRIINSIIALKEIPVLALSWMVLLLSCFNKYKFLLKGAALFICSFIVMALFCFLIGLTEQRVYFGLSVMCTIIIAYAIRNCIKEFNVPVSARYGLAALLFLLSIPYNIQASNKTKDYLLYANAVEERIIDSPDSCIVEMPPAVISSRFVYATKVDANRFQGHNKIRAFYYRKQYVQGLPSELMGMVDEEKLDHSLYPFWFYPYANGKNVVSVFYEVDPDIDNAHISKRQRIIRYCLGTLYLTQYQQYYIDFENHGVEYLALPIKDNVEHIVICLKDGSKEVLIPPADTSHLILSDNSVL